MTAHILVLGGGFAGLAAVNELASQQRKGADIAVTLIDRRPHSVFLPLLPDLVAGMTQPHHLCYSLQPHCDKRGAKFIQAQIRSIDPEQTAVHADHGVFKGDFLIICLGSVTHYFGHDELAPQTCRLNGVMDAMTVTSRCSDLIDAKACARARSTPHIFVVGGGCTGFEAATQVAALAHLQTGQPYATMRELLDIRILEISDNVLPHSSENVRAWATRLTTGYGVEIMTQRTVVAIKDKQTAVLSDGSEYKDALVIWAAGVIPSPPCTQMPVRFTKGQRLQVDAFLRLPQFPHIFAAGDAAGAIPPGKTEPLYMGVQFSLRGGRCAAQNVIRQIAEREMRVFDPADLGYVVPLAPGHASGHVLGKELRGKLPYTLHYAMSAFRSWGLRNKKDVACDYLFRRQVMRAEQRRRAALSY